jgi:hypothetical protein
MDGCVVVATRSLHVDGWWGIIILFWWLQRVTALKVHEGVMRLKVYTSVKRVTSIRYTNVFLYTSLTCLRPISLGGLNPTSVVTTVDLPPIFLLTK